MREKKEKLILVFDEKDRRNFLTGFRKRKNARRKKAKEENQKKEEERRKQLREEKREALRQHVEEYESQLASNDETVEESVTKQESVTHDFEQHTVMVSTITDEDMGKDFLTCAYPTQNEPKVTDSKISSENHKQTAKDKLTRKRQFKKKAQKRKIQAMSDKKGSKQKQRKRGRQK